MVAVNKPSYDVLVLLNDLARSIRTEADRRARMHGMTRANWVILSRLHQSPGLSQRELAEILEVEPITVGRLVDRLEARDLVERRPDPVDRRIWRLHLRPTGLPALEVLNTQRDAILDLVTEGIDPSELERMTETLLRMKANMSACRVPALKTS
jgi:DNA-binding MarR family transcriptional regulator